MSLSCSHAPVTAPAYLDDLPAASGPLPSPPLPSVRRLAALGAVLCLHPGDDGSALDGWHRAVSARAHVAVDSDGMAEHVQFIDAHGRCCWQLHLLPESDFFGWERLLAGLPSTPHAMPCGDAGHDPELPLATRLWRRLAGGLDATRWQACALRLHGLREPQDGRPLLAASTATLSPLGTVVAQRITRRHLGDRLRPATVAARAHALSDTA